MNKLDNYIYLTICEVAMKEFKKTYYSSFVNFCKGIGHSLNHGNLSSREKASVIEVLKLLDVIYSMDDEENSRYISNFFNLEAEYIRMFELCVLETKECFPMAFG